MKIASIYFLLLLGIVNDVFAFCVNERHQSATQEFDASKYVIIGAQISQSIITPSDDPDGVAAMIYSVRPIEQFKGNGAADNIKIWSENSSSRFIIENEETYFLFIKSGPDGLYIDNCGNSGILGNKDTDRVLNEVKLLSKSQKQ